MCDLVRVEFNGCAAANLPTEIDVDLGGESLTVRKQPDGTWEGRAQSSFRPAQQSLTVDLPNIRTTCHVAGSSQKIAGGASCRAVFSVRCEPLWSLHVSNTMKKQKTPLSYRWDSDAGTVHWCDDPRPPGKDVALVSESPLTIAPVGVSQGVILALTAADGTAVEYTVKERALRKLGKQVKLCDLPPRAAVQSAVVSGPFLSALKQQQARAFEHIVLTWDTP